MRKLLGALLVSAWVPCVAFAGSWEKVSLVDKMCVSKVKGDPDKHPASCALKCADSGYLIQTADGWVKLDDAGNKLAIAQLKSTKRKDHVRVNVSGEKKGEVIAVSSLRMAD